MEILMTFLNEKLRKVKQQKWKRERERERYEKNKTYTSIFGLFFYNQIIPSKRQTKINNFLTATRTERENDIFIKLK